MQSHYRKSLVFTYENLDNAKTAYNKLTARIAQLMADKKPDEVVELEDFEKFKGSFKAALDDDINTSNAITVLYDVLKADTNNETKLAYPSFDRCSWSDRRLQRSSVLTVKRISLRRSRCLLRSVKLQERQRTLLRLTS